MKEVIRDNIFETNSSSVHSLTFRNNLEPSELAKRNGYTYAHFGEFGKEYMKYFDQQTKLDYLVSYLYYLIGGCSTLEDIYDCYEFKILQEAVCEHAGTKGLKIAKNPAEPMIDHQSMPDNGGGFLSWSDYYNKEFLQNFIFNPEVGFQTDCD